MSSLGAKLDAQSSWMRKMCLFCTILFLSVVIVQGGMNNLFFLYEWSTKILTIEIGQALRPEWGAAMIGAAMLVLA